MCPLSGRTRDAIAAVEASAVKMGSTECDTPVLVLGSGVTALGVVRTLGLRGIPLYVASMGEGLEAYSRWYRPAPVALRSPAFSTDDPAERLALFLEASGLERAVLMPCTDILVESVARLPLPLAERFPSSLSSPKLLERLVDKAELAALLLEHAVPHPKTAIVAGPGDVAAEVGAAMSDAFVKPRDSQRFFAKYGVKAFRPSGRDELSRVVERVVADGVEVVVQEYVPGPPSNHYFIDGFVDRHGEVRAVFARRRLRMYPPWFGNSSAVRSVPREETAHAEEDLVRFLEAVGYRGIFSAEFKRDARDGTFRLLEINARAWWYVEFATRSGVDVVTMAYEDALGRDVERVENYQVGRTVVYPYYDFFAFLEGRRVGSDGLVKGLSSWIGADHTVFAFDDPAPFFRELMKSGRRFVTRRLPRLQRPENNG